jgi:hypothetical protein
VVEPFNIRKKVDVPLSACLFYLKSDFLTSQFIRSRVREIADNAITTGQIDDSMYSEALALLVKLPGWNMTTF